MRDVKTRATMEQPKTRQQNAIPRTAVRISQRHYAQQKKERQTQHQRQPVEYATEQAQQGAADTARLTFRATQQLQRKYVLHKYRAQKVRQRQETTAAQVCQRDMWRSTEQTAAAQYTATVPRQPAQKPPTAAKTAAQQRAKQQTQRAAQRQMLQQTKAAARKAGQRLEQMARAVGKIVRAGVEAIAAAGGGVVLFLLLALPVIAVAAALSPAGVLADSHTMEPPDEALEVWERRPDDLSMERRMVVTYALALVVHCASGTGGVAISHRTGFETAARPVWYGEE